MKRLIAGVLLLGIVCAAGQPGSSRSPIGFIGDSITAGGNPTPADWAAQALGTVATNQAVPGATTGYWLPTGAPFQAAVHALGTDHVRLVHIMLGTNDATPAHRLPVVDYLRQMQAITAALRRAGFTAVVSCSPYVVPGSHQGLIDAAMNTRLLAYCAALAGLPGIQRGDTRAFVYFQAHPNQLRDGVHPNALGIRALGQLWAAALSRYAYLLHLRRG